MSKKTEKTLYKNSQETTQENKTADVTETYAVTTENNQQTASKTLIVALKNHEDLKAVHEKDEEVEVVSEDEFKAKNLSMFVVIVFVWGDNINPSGFAKELTKALNENEKAGIVGISPYSATSSLRFDEKGLAYFPAISAGTLAIRTTDFLQISTQETQFSDIKLCNAIRSLKKNTFYLRMGAENTGYKYALTTKQLNAPAKKGCCY